MAGFIIDTSGRKWEWHGQNVPFGNSGRTTFMPGHLPRSVKNQADRFQVDGDELTFALYCLRLNPTDHNPRVQTFMGTAMRKIFEAIPS